MKTFPTVIVLTLLTEAVRNSAMSVATEDNVYALNTNAPILKGVHTLLVIECFRREKWQCVYYYRTPNEISIC